MATKKIVASVTLHVPNKSFTPNTYDALGGVVVGAYKVDAIAPGTPTDLDADEADALIARGLAEEVKSETPAKAGKPADAPAA